MCQCKPRQRAVWDGLLDRPLTLVQVASLYVHPGRAGLAHELASLDPWNGANQPGRTRHAQTAMSSPFGGLPHISVAASNSLPVWGVRVRISEISPSVLSPRVDWSLASPPLSEAFVTELTSGTARERRSPFALDVHRGVSTACSASTLVVTNY